MTFPDGDGAEPTESRRHDRTTGHRRLERRAYWRKGNVNHLRQTKTYRCLRCEAIYIHDESYFHASFECAQREGVATKIRHMAQPRIEKARPGRSREAVAETLIVRRESQGVCG